MRLNSDLRKENLIKMASLSWPNITHWLKFNRTFTLKFSVCLFHGIRQNKQKVRQKFEISTYSLLSKHIDKIMFIIVTSDATTAIVTTFLLSSFDDIWGFGIFELVFFAMVEDPFVVAVIGTEFCIVVLFERVFLVGAEGWFVFSFPVPVLVAVAAIVVPVVVAGVWVVGKNVVIGSWMKRVFCYCFYYYILFLFL